MNAIFARIFARIFGPKKYIPKRYVIQVMYCAKPALRSHFNGENEPGILRIGSAVYEADSFKQAYDMHKSDYPETVAFSAYSYSGPPPDAEASK